MNSIIEREHSRSAREAEERSSQTPEGWIAPRCDSVPKYLSILMASLSNELRNPLAPIRNVASLMRRASLTAQQLEDISSLLDRQSAKLVHLADDLLEVSQESASGRTQRAWLRLISAGEAQDTGRHFSPEE